MKKLLTALVVSTASIALAGASKAATVTQSGVTLTESTLSSSAASTSLGLSSLAPQTGGTNTSNLLANPAIGLGANGSLGNLYLGGSAIVQGSVAGQYTAPASATGSYLSVYSGTYAAFTLANGASDVSLTWGTVDPSNFIAVVTTTGSTVFTGAELESLDSGITRSATTVYANFASAAPITEIILGSGQNSFEVADVSVSPVPLPGALPLFGGALAGIGLLSRRRKRLAMHG